MGPTHAPPLRVDELRHMTVEAAGVELLMSKEFMLTTHICS
jgi:hypothetical protein